MRGQIYFAWINEDEDFDDTVHNVFDENVYSFTLTQSEGDFASLQLTVKNPRIGLLNTGRKVWCYLAVNDGTNIVPIFKGRLIGIPTNIFDTLVQFDFTARPSDFVAQKIALANSMKVLPWYDSIFVSPDSWGDPDVVLEAYSKLWHIDPVTHVVTASDILVPEDGVEEVTADQHFYDDMEMTLSSTPLRRVQVIATIPWTQGDEGTIDLTRRLKRAFGDDVLSSFTMKGFVQDYPKPGGSFGSGWKVSAGTAITDISATYPVIKIPDVFSWQGVVPNLPEGSIAFPLKITGEYHWGEKAGFNLQFELVVAAKGYAVATLGATYTAGREFGQVVTFTLETDQQAIVTLPGDDEAMIITLNANKVSEATEDTSIPIVDVKRRNYTHTPRGMQSIQHLLLVARAHLIARSRAVESKFSMEFIDALRMRSLRKGSLLHDPRIPGGQASGKITSYEYSLDGDSGEAKAVITIASTVGYGGAYSETAGDPVYVEDDYVEDDWQDRINQVRLLDTEDIAYTMPESANFDDGIDFVKGLNGDNAVLQFFVTNDADTQAGVINGASAGANTDQAKISTVLKANPTTVTVQLVPMEGGPFQQEVVVSVSDLIVPQNINLEAPSNA